MKCPFCGGDMESGNIFGKGDIRTTWYPEGKTPPYVYTLKNSLERGGIPLSTLRLYRHSGFPTYICRACRKGVFDIPPIDEVSDIEI